MPWVTCKPLCRAWLLRSRTVSSRRFRGLSSTHQPDHVESASKPEREGKRARAMLVNGRAMANDILQEIRSEVKLMEQKFGGRPGLAVISIGERPDSAKYVAMKNQVAESIGFNSFSMNLPESASHEEVLQSIKQFNGDDRCHGILLQLPVPGHLDPRALLGAIKVEKDVECFHPMNAGRLTLWRKTVIAPCTPRGIMEMLRRSGVEIRGKHAVVLGESNVVGLPMALMLNAAHATVSLLNKDTVDPGEFIRRADIVVAAVGKAEYVKAEWVKPGATVIDVGFNFVKDGRRVEGFLTVGDVHPDVRGVAGIVTPVPGGVGPMTVAMLMRNCTDMAALGHKWGQIAGVLHPSHAAETARRMQGAMLDLAVCSHHWEGSESDRESRKDDDDPEIVPEEPRERAQQRQDAHQESAGRAAGRALQGVTEDYEEGEELRSVLEKVGRSITDAELLTIINDTERNAYNLLSFLEAGGDKHHRSLEEVVAHIQHRSEHTPEHTSEVHGPGTRPPPETKGAPPEMDTPTREAVRSSDPDEGGEPDEGSETARLEELLRWRREADQASTASEKASDCPKRHLMQEISEDDHEWLLRNMDQQVASPSEEQRRGGE